MCDCGENSLGCDVATVDRHVGTIAVAVVGVVVVVVVGVGVLEGVLVLGSCGGGLEALSACPLTANEAR